MNKMIIIIKWNFSMRYFDDAQHEIDIRSII